MTCELVKLKKYLSLQLLRKLRGKTLTSSEGSIPHSEHLEIAIHSENSYNVLVILNVSWEGVGLASVLEDESREEVDQVDLRISISFKDVGLIFDELPFRIGVDALIDLFDHFRYFSQIGSKIVNHRVDVCMFGSVEVFKIK
jgi:hypothetical protein